MANTLSMALARVAGRPTTAPIVAERARASLHAASGLLASAVLADSAVEHYRGSFRNPAMILPLAASAFSVIANATGRLRAPAQAASAFVGLLGLGFHAYNILKRPGGLSWANLFYSAPFGAPAALTLSGLIGRLGGRRRLGAGRGLAAVAAAGLAGTTAEAGLLHFRGAFQNPFMLLPVTLPPLAAAMLAWAALSPGDRHPTTRHALRLTAALGFAGMGFHVYGVSRAMGGWRNWRQNLVDGPPIPAPPSFTALALVGLAALNLLQAS